MTGLLSGLEKLGLKNLENMDVFEDEKKQAAEQAQKQKAPEVKEADFLFDKTYECPVCDNKFKARTMKAGKAKLLHTDMDLRPVYEHIEPLKYDPIICPDCGYSALSRYFGGLTAVQIKAIKDTISKSFQRQEQNKEVYTFEEAAERYKLCLANAIVKHAKASEKAYICLKGGWLQRAMADALDKESPDYAAKHAQIKGQEKEFLKNALDGFLAARQSENYPMCGMDESTVDYLTAVLAMQFEQFDAASKLISGILVSPSATSRMKDKARELKEILIAKIKEKNAG